MKNWKLKITIFSFLILFVFGIFYTQTNTVKAFSSDHSCSSYDKSTKVGASLSNMCYQLDKTIGILNDNKNGEGKPFTDKQKAELTKQINNMETNFNDAVAYSKTTDPNTTSDKILAFEKNGTDFYNAALKAVNTNDTVVDQQKADAEKKACGSWSGLNLPQCISDILAYVSYYILIGVSYFVGICGLLFDAVLKYTVINIKSSLEIVPIEQGWILFRDLGNFVFIFVLVYIAIRTILGLDNGDTKILIRNVIIIGLLVNFSLFFTKFLVDISNVFSIVFYNKMVGGATTNGAVDTVNSFSARFVQPLGIPTIPGGGPSSDAFVALITKSNSGLDRTANIVIYTLGGSLFLIFVAFSFLYASVLFFIRYLAIIFIMIISPLAFFAYVVPSFRNWFHGWKNTLIGMLTFAPLYLMLMFLTLAIATSLSSVSGGSISDALTSPSATSITSALKFILILGLINAAAILATKVAASSGGIVSAAINKVQGIAPQRAAIATGGYAGRATIGRRASSSLEGAKGEQLKQKMATGNFVTRNLAKASYGARDYLAKSSFDVRNTKPVQNFAKSIRTDLGKGQQGGYRQDVKEQRARFKSQIENVGGASAETRKSIAVAQRGINKNRIIHADAQIDLRELQQKLDKAKEAYKTDPSTENQEVVTKLDTQVREARKKVVAARKALSDHEGALKKATKTRETEIREQKIQFAQRQTKGVFSRFKRTGGLDNFVGPQAAYEAELQDLIKNTGKANEDKVQAEADTFKDQIEEFKADGDYDGIAKLFKSKIKDNHLDKLPGSVYMNGDKIDYRIVSKLSEGQRKQLVERRKGDLTDDQRDGIGQFLDRVTTT